MAAEKNENRRDHTQENGSYIVTDSQELRMLAERIGKEDTGFLIESERIFDSLMFLVNNLKLDKYAVANGLMDVTIEYICKNFQGAYLNWDSGEDPNKDIKKILMKSLGFHQDDV